MTEAITNIGVTGTRNPLPAIQEESLQQVLASLYRLGARILHHGDCVGADKTADIAAFNLGMHIESHPPQSARHRAFCDALVVHRPKPYLARNRDVVNACQVLVGCPKGPETPRGGTWYTVRYARKAGCQVILVWPDGSVTGDLKTTD
jgi:hypothetical protein